MSRRIVFACSVSAAILLAFLSVVSCEPPANAGWGQQQNLQNSGGYSQQQTGAYSSGYSAPAGGYSGGQSVGGWGQQQQAQVQSGGWGQQQQQAQVQSGGWGQQQQAQVQSSNQGGQGWGPQLNLELDTANLKVENLSPAKLFRSIIGIPRKIVEFIRESGLYLLFIPLIIILPLMLLAFNFGRTIGGLKWGWHKRSMSSAVESGILGYLKSPVWQKIGETLMNEQNFELIMKSIDEFKKMKKKNW